MKTFKQHIQEALNKPRIVCVYSGRFQPFHPGHKESYDNLVLEFGKENVYIGTSNKVELPKSPLNFKEKYTVITTMFPDIPKSNIIQVKNPYNPIEVLQKLPDDTVYIAAVGKKDSERLSKKYFDMYSSDLEFKPYKERSYIFIIPKNKKRNLSGTMVRETFKNADDKEKAFIEIYERLNKKIAKLLGDKIQ